MTAKTHTRPARERAGWVALSCAAGCVSALAVVAQLLNGSEQRWSDLFTLGLAPDLAAVAGAGAALGAALALPAVARAKRIIHPSVALWMLMAFGMFGWLAWLEGAQRIGAQLALAGAIVMALRKLRHAGAAPARIAGAALIAGALVPIGIATSADVQRAWRAEWRFEDKAGAETLRAKAARLSQREAARPDLWLVIAERYPSPDAARARGTPYGEAALGALRARGWAIRERAVTAHARTDLTLARAFALTRRITDGTRSEVPDAATLEAHAARGALAWRDAFRRPVLLDVLHEAGYETRGAVGWWLATQALPFDRLDRLDGNLPGGTLARAVARAWVYKHMAWLDAQPRGTDPGIAKSLWVRCRAIAAQRERLFEATNAAKPLFAFYHLYWLHDLAAMDSEGRCVNDAPATPRSGSETLDDRVQALIAYMPRFLARLEAHARAQARGAGFRILVFADEGLSADAHHGGGADVLRATYAEGVPALWAEEAIPDLAPAVRTVVDALLEGHKGEDTHTEGD